MMVTMVTYPVMLVVVVILVAPKTVPQSSLLSSLFFSPSPSCSSSLSPSSSAVSVKAGFSCFGGSERLHHIAATSAYAFPFVVIPVKVRHNKFNHCRKNINSRNRCLQVSESLTKCSTIIVLRTTKRRRKPRRLQAIVDENSRLGDVLRYGKGDENGSRHDEERSRLRDAKAVEYVNAVLPSLSSSAAAMESLIHAMAVLNGKGVDGGGGQNNGWNARFVPANFDRGSLLEGESRAGLHPRTRVVVTEVKSILFLVASYSGSGNENKDRRWRALGERSFESQSTSMSALTSWPRAKGQNWEAVLAVVPAGERVDTTKISSHLLSKSRRYVPQTTSIGDDHERKVGCDEAVVAKETVSSRRKDTQKGEDEKKKKVEVLRVELAPSGIVREICGFEPGTVPPLMGVWSSRDGGGHSEANPAAAGRITVLIDKRLVSGAGRDINDNIIMNEENDGWMVNTSHSSPIGDGGDAVRRMILGGGGSGDRRCLVSVRAMLSMDGVEATDLVETTNFTPAGLKSNKERRDLVSNVPFSAHGGGVSDADCARDDYLARGGDWKPFFPVAPPPVPASADHETLSTASSSGQTVEVTVIGCLTSVRRMARRLVFADLAPPPDCYDRGKQESGKGQGGVGGGVAEIDANAFKGSDSLSVLALKKDLPWRSGVDGLDMAVQLIAGKTLCKNLGYDVEGPAALRKMKVGQVLVVSGRVNFDPHSKNGWTMTSKSNWRTNRTLDMIVSSFQILDHVEMDNNNGDQRGKASVRNARADAGESTTENASSSSLPFAGQYLPVLRLSELYGLPECHCTTLINCTESLDILSGAMSSLQREEGRNNSIETTGKEGNSPPSLRPHLVGIDCEWRPTGLYSRNLCDAAQPVALLQISIPTLRRVFLLDLQTLIRTGMPRTMTRPNEAESRFSFILNEMLSSTSFVKVGFHVVADLRRLAASFPHIPAFTNASSVLELPTAARRLWPRLTRRSSSPPTDLSSLAMCSSRQWTGSLAKLTKLLMKRELSKLEQCSDWSRRPLTEAQIEYASLDAAVPPFLLENMLRFAFAGEDDDNDGEEEAWCGRSPLGFGSPVFSGVLEKDFLELLSNLLTSWRFLTFVGANDAKNDEDDIVAIQRLKAKKVVGCIHVVSQSWITGRKVPEIPWSPGQRGKTYVDNNGILRAESKNVSVGRMFRLPYSSELVGQRVGKTKGKCIQFIMAASSVLPGTEKRGPTLDFNPRSGYVEFSDSVALFLNTPSGSKKRSYPNEWSNGGRSLTWYLRESEWKDGTSDIARKLMTMGSPETHVNGDATLPSPFPRHKEGKYGASPPILFVKLENGIFVYCGRCTVSREPLDGGTCVDHGGVMMDAEEFDTSIERCRLGFASELVEFYLTLLDWEALSKSEDFSFMQRLLKGRSNNELHSHHRSEVASEVVERGKKFPVDFDSSTELQRQQQHQIELAKMILRGDVVGALLRALELENTSPRKRSIGEGIVCLENALSNSNDPLVLKAIKSLSVTLKGESLRFI